MKMTDKEYGNFLFAVKNFKHVCISIHLFTELLKLGNDVLPVFEPITDMKVMMTGLYGKVLGAHIWVSKIASADNTYTYDDKRTHIRVCNKEHASEVNARDSADWSPLIALDELDRFVKLVTFW